MKLSNKIKPVMRRAFPASATFESFTTNTARMVNEKCVCGVTHQPDASVVSRGMHSHHPRRQAYHGNKHSKRAVSHNVRWDGPHF